MLILLSECEELDQAMSVLPLAQQSCHVTPVCRIIVHLASRPCCNQQMPPVGRKGMRACACVRTAVPL